MKRKANNTTFDKNIPIKKKNVLSPLTHLDTSNECTNLNLNIPWYGDGTLNKSILNLHFFDKFIKDIKDIKNINENQYNEKLSNILSDFYYNINKIVIQIITKEIDEKKITHILDILNNYITIIKENNINHTQYNNNNHTAQEKNNSQIISQYEYNKQQQKNIKSIQPIAKNNQLNNPLKKPGT